MKTIILKTDGTVGRRTKNPKTAAQTLQRILVKVVALAYAMFKAICNHSFEGITPGAKSANKFMKVNLMYLRQRAASLQNSGQSLSQPSYSTMATINGVSQNISGGSVIATAPVTSVVVSGTNLGDVVFTAKVDGTGDAISPTSHDANGASFTALNVAAGHSLVVYHGGTIWFNVSSQENDDFPS